MRTAPREVPSVRYSRARLELDRALKARDRAKAQEVARRIARGDA